MEAICPNCGAHYYGWALVNPDFQKCAKCGNPLQIINEYLPPRNCSDQIINAKIHP
jgi:hypothetical protein